ncbi:hypothetical protein ACQ4M3_08845 [Leptolyngbya sp. AN03gr2]|uniref:hypothetical protein n=1 Tax=unclassified Leptolyngbya TaxID=2650499 RepID=UPI003D310D29
MTWNTIATIQITPEWQFTSPIPLNLGYVRLTFSTAGVPVAIAQVEPDLENWSDERQIMATPFAQILEFSSPLVFTKRALALKSPTSTAPFEVRIEVSSLPIDLGGPGGGGTIDLLPVLMGQAEILEQLQSIDVEFDPQIAANIQSIVNSQASQNTALSQLQTRQIEILQALNSIDVELDPQIAANILSIVNSQASQTTALQQISQAVASLNPSDRSPYFDYLDALVPVVIVPLNDTTTEIRNRTGAIVGAISGTYQQSQPSLLTSDAAALSTRFNGGRIALSQSYTAPQNYTIVVRARITPGNSFVPFCHFGASSEFNNASFDRQFFMYPDGRVEVFNFNGSVVAATSTASFNDGLPHTFVARTGPNGISVFVDGILVASRSNAGAINQTGFWKLFWMWNGIINQPSLANNVQAQGVAIFHDALTNGQIIKLSAL